MDVQTEEQLETQMNWFSFDKIESWTVPRSPPDPLGAVMLRAMANDLAWWGTVRFTPGRSVDRYLVDFYYRGVPYSPSEWFGDLDSGHRQRCSRVCRQLEQDRYLYRVTESQRDRVRCLVPTLHGLTWPLRTAPQAKIQGVVSGLRKTEWGQELADQLLAKLAKT